MYFESALFMTIFLIAALVLLAIYIPFLLTLQNCLKAISPQNRRMPPGQVWLMLIPLFHFVWQFIVVMRVAESIEAEYMMRGLDSELKPTQGIGMAWAILSICGAIPVVGSVASIAGFVCWIIYWVRVAEHKNRISSMPPYAGNESSIFGAY